MKMNLSMIKGIKHNMALKIKRRKLKHKMQVFGRKTSAGLKILIDLNMTDFLSMKSFLYPFLYLYLKFTFFFWKIIFIFFKR
jgi:hypothetical protein